MQNAKRGVEKHVEHRRTLNVFVLSMLSVAVVISLRNLPLTASYGLGLIFFYLAATIFFMIPYALVSAELASGWPKGGGVFIWVKEALGERWGFFAIWMQWFHNMTWFPAMLAFIASGIAYVIDPALATNKTYLLVVVVGGFWTITLLNFLGVKASALTSTICVIIGVLIPGGLLIALGIDWYASGMPLHFSTDLHSLIPDFSQFSNLVFLAGIFLSLSGLEANANLAREVINPQKNYPKAIFIGAFLTLLVMVLGSLSIAAVIPKEEIGLVSGLYESFTAFLQTYHLTWLIPIIIIFIVLGSLGELNAWVMAGVKGLFVSTEYGCLPPIFLKMNKRHVPVNLLLFQAILVTIAALAFLFLPGIDVSYWALSALSSQMYLLMYILMLASGIVLRYRRPEVHRGYKIPGNNAGMWIAGVVGILACLFTISASFFAPEKFKEINVVGYEIMLVGGLALSCAIPLVIYACRKPHWAVEIKKEIRDDIHNSMH